MRSLPLKVTKKQQKALEYLKPLLEGLCYSQFSATASNGEQGYGVMQYTLGPITVSVPGMQDKEKNTFTKMGQPSLQVDLWNLEVK